MTQQNHITTRELMDQWEMDPVDLYHHLHKGLPAETFDRHTDRWRKLQVRWIDPDGSEFEKQILKLRFWKPAVEQWEKGGPEALAEFRRLKFTSMDDLPAEPVVEDPLPTKRKRKLKKNILETRQEFVKYYEMVLNHKPGRLFSWYIDRRLTENVRWPDGTVIGRGTFYKWKKLHEEGELF